MNATQADLYGGRENLEAMEAAVKYNRWLVDLVATHLSRGERILDFGAGTGTITQLLRADGFEILAVEPDPELARQLERRGIAVERHLDSLDEGAVAAVVSFNVLEHIEDDAAVLRALHGKLRAAGRLLVYVPAFPLLYSSMDRRVGHVRRYRRRALAALLERTGYRVDSVRHVDTLGFFAALAYRLLARTHGVLNPRSVRTYDRFVFPISRWIDRVTAGALGKNLFAVCTKQAHDSPQEPL